MGNKARWYRVRMRDGLEHIVNATGHDADEFGRGFLCFYKEGDVILAVPLEDVRFWGRTSSPQVVQPRRLLVSVRM